MRRKILLIEPNYNNKFPPIGLMKISTYHKLLGDEVVFYKGEIKDFILDRVVNQCIDKLSLLEPSIVWRIHGDIIKEYIKTRKESLLDKLPLENLDGELLLVGWLHNYKDYYWKKKYLENPEWDRIFITTLFTFYFDITVRTINEVKGLVKKDGLLMVGGVLASLQPEEIELATGVKPYQGLLYHLDDDNDYDIDSLPLDYTILDEIDYKYEMNEAYYAYTTRGCIRKCDFCAVHRLEPQYIDYIPLRERIEQAREIIGEQQHLLLMDNNVLASKSFDSIIQDIVDSGFAKGSKCTPKDELELSVNNLRKSINDRAYIRKTQFLLLDFYNKVKDDSDYSYEVYSAMEDNKVLKLITSTKDNLIMAYERIEPFYKKYTKAKNNRPGKLKSVDFNQGVDARLFNPHVVEQLARIAIRPLRIAFDNIKTTSDYLKAVRMSANVGIKEFSNYLLYNFDDKPIDLYKRLRINVELCDELKVNIYSFPMKYHPLFGDYSHNRDYVGKYWNRKYIRAVQAILNCTKGQIGRGESFFLKAFGNDENEYMELLEMPDTFILYRFFFEWIGDKNEMSTDNWRTCWNECKKNLSNAEWEELMRIIHDEKIDNWTEGGISNISAIRLLGFYRNLRKDIVTEGTELYKLKKEYDANPTKVLRRHRCL